jgi:hypothetical protein
MLWLAPEMFEANPRIGQALSFRVSLTALAP